MKEELQSIVQMPFSRDLLKKLAARYFDWPESLRSVFRLKWMIAHCSESVPDFIVRSDGLCFLKKLEVAESEAWLGFDQ